MRTTPKLKLMLVLASRTRLFELMSEALERALAPREQKELDALLLANPDISAEDFELAAAAAFLAFDSQEPQPLPAKLKSKLIASTTQRPHFRLVAKD